MAAEMTTEMTAEIAAVQNGVVTIDIPVDLRALADRYMAQLDSESAETRRTYRAAIGRMLSHFAAQGIVRPDREDMRAYRGSMRAQGLKPATVNLYLTAARVFCAWLVGEGYLTANPAEGLKGAKMDYSEGHKKDYLTAAQVKDVMGTAETDTLAGLRDKAVIALMVTTGLRCIEVARADMEDMRTAGGGMVLYIQGKGRAEKCAYVKLAAPVERAIREYLAARGAAEGEPLFTATGNRRGQGGRLTTRTISGIVKWHMREAGMDDSRHTAHSLRHTAATLNLLHGGTLQETQQLLRHTNINTTLIYQHALERESNCSEERVADAIF